MPLQHRDGVARGKRVEQQRRHLVVCDLLVLGATGVVRVEGDLGPERAFVHAHHGVEVHAILGDCARLVEHHCGDLASNRDPRWLQASNLQVAAEAARGDSLTCDQADREHGAQTLCDRAQGLEIQADPIAEVHKEDIDGDDEEHVDEHDAVDDRQLIVVLEAHRGREQDHPHKLPAGRQGPYSAGNHERVPAIGIGGLQAQGAGVRNVLLRDRRIRGVLDGHLLDGHRLSSQHGLIDHEAALDHDAVAGQLRGAIGHAEDVPKGDVFDVHLLPHATAQNLAGAVQLRKLGSFLPTRPHDEQGTVDSRAPGQDHPEEAQVPGAEDVVGPGPDGREDAGEVRELGHERLGDARHVDDDLVGPGVGDGLRGLLLGHAAAAQGLVDLHRLVVDDAHGAEAVIALLVDVAHAGVLDRLDGPGVAAVAVLHLPHGHDRAALGPLEAHLQLLHLRVQALEACRHGVRVRVLQVVVGHEGDLLLDQDMGGLSEGGDGNHEARLPRLPEDDQEHAQDVHEREDDQPAADNATPPTERVLVVGRQARQPIGVGQGPIRGIGEEAEDDHVDVAGAEKGGPGSQQDVADQVLLEAELQEGPRRVVRGVEGELLAQGIFGPSLLLELRQPVVSPQHEERVEHDEYAQTNDHARDDLQPQGAERHHCAWSPVAPYATK
mmetsp:Transcript_7028/g.17991  ORF Transcript_7028/g.17991 Transcript_7028/m.17991 type:complete len:665 (+) Transcript_7028:2278-4272(+)